MPNKPKNYPNAWSRWRMATLVFCVCVGLGGCEKLNQVLGPSKQAPDEFTVYSRAPLAIPPDYGLHPPKPGAPRPQNLENRGRARAVVLGRTSAPTHLPRALEQASPGIRDFLSKSGAMGLDPNIREIVGKETGVLAEENRGVVDGILFWSAGGEYGKVIDADKEARRLKEKEALDGAVNEASQPKFTRE